MKNFYVFLLTAALIIGCKKNDDDSPGNSTPPPSSEVTISISGMVVDESGNGIAGVSLKVGNMVKGSDGNGFFVFENVKVPSKRYYVSANRDGFFESGSGGIPKSNTTHYVKIRLIAHGMGSTVSQSSGGTVNSNNGAKIIFPANALITPSGYPMVGSATVYTRYLSTSDAAFASLVPGGDLAFASGSGTLYPLESFGMIAVTIKDQGGMNLNLASGKTAELRMPIAASQLANAPSAIPLVFFDPVTGIWSHEGTAIKTGNEYVGSVSHFSWWNCDVITGEPLTTITGKIVDCQGIPIPGITVTVNSQFTTITNNLGVYANWVPAGIPITVEIMGAMNNGVYLSTQPVTISTNPGQNVVPNIVVACPAYLTGNVTNCAGNATPFYVWASWANNSTIAVYSSNVSFQIGVVSNQSVTLHFSNGQLAKDTTVTSGNFGAVVNIGALSLCTGATTGCTGGTNTVIDIDGNVYNVVQIGNQCWMKENLKTSRYRNGDTIEYIPRQPIVDDSVWHSRTTGAYVTIDNDVYGKLYNWYAVADPAGLCPTGWHVPDSAEMVQLSLFLGGDNIAGGALKQTGTAQAGTGLWSSPNTGATNISGFTGLPAGVRAGGTGGNGGTTYFWTSTVGNVSSAWFRHLFQSDAAFSAGGATKTNGSSVRCVRD